MAKSSILGLLMEDGVCELYKYRREAGGKGVFLPNRQSMMFLRLLSSYRLPTNLMAGETAAASEAPD